MEIVMKTKVEVIEQIKPTKARMFENVEIGDVLEFSVPVHGVGVSRGRSYTVDIKIKNLRNNEVTFSTFNQVGRTLKLFKFKEVI